MEVKSSSQTGYYCCFFCTIFEILKQNRPLKSVISDVFYPMFANCVDANVGIFVNVWSDILVSPNCSKFSVECDWNGKKSENFQNLSFLEN